MIGAYPLDEADVATLEWMGIDSILNLVEDDEYEPGEREVVREALKAAGIEERRLRFPDYGGLPPAELEAAVQQISSWLDDGRRTYVHCRAGWQRSAAVAAAVVALREGLDVDAALGDVRSRKPSADPLPHQRDDLRRWFETRGTIVRGRDWAKPPEG